MEAIERESTLNPNTDEKITLQIKKLLLELLGDREIIENTSIIILKDDQNKPQRLFIELNSLRRDQCNKIFEILSREFATLWENTRVVTNGTMFTLQFSLPIYALNSSDQHTEYPSSAYDLLLPKPAHETGAFSVILNQIDPITIDDDPQRRDEFHRKAAELEQAFRDVIKLQ